MLDSRGKRNSLIDYTNYQLQQREDNFNALIKGGKLLQQYVCHKYCDIERQRLLYIQDQDKFRVYLYIGWWVLQKCKFERPEDFDPSVIIPMRPEKHSAAVPRRNDFSLEVRHYEHLLNNDMQSEMERDS